VRRAALAAGLAAVFAGAAPAAADHTVSLRADVRETGYVRLHLHARAGVEVVIQGEGGAIRRLTPARSNVRLDRFARWSCKRRSRSFVATQTGADGAPVSATAEVRTPSCAKRLALAAPRSVRAGARQQVELRDRWGIGGIRARLCVRPPGERSHCRRVRLPRDSASRPVPVDALRPGNYRITARTPYQRLRRAMRAAPRGGRLKVLATGDSMIQIIDSYLQQRIGSGPARVRSDAHISTGISKPSLLDWPAHAMRRARSMRPDVTVMFLGANDGFPMAGAACCGRAWQLEYARRARGMMRTYARGGRARVYWLLLPAPRGGNFRKVYFAVNAALRRAARGLEDDVRLIDLVEVFTPGWRYRDSMPVGGRTVRVRQSDGVHLNTTGASLAATLVIRAMRRDRILR
jgi:antitoxin (DNA-binding transcriptional repressor) of toxin-antitoxin stability system